MPFSKLACAIFKNFAVVLKQPAEKGRFGLSDNVFECISVNKSWFQRRMRVEVEVEHEFPLWFLSDQF